MTLFLYTVNLALHGTAEQETTYTDSDGNSYSANLAIEGPSNNNWEDGCSSTAAGQSTQWWGMSFPKLVYITNIIYYLRNDSKFLFVLIIISLPQP